MPRAKTAKPRAFGDIFAKYKHYDPATEGYGGPETWTEAFFSRMGFEEAQRVVHGAADTPRGILGLPIKCLWEDVRTAFRKRCLETHPDRMAFHGLTKEQAEEAFKKVSAAYEVLMREFGKG